MSITINDSNTLRDGAKQYAPDEWNKIEAEIAILATEKDSDYTTSALTDKLFENLGDDITHAYKTDPEAKRALREYIEQINNHAILTKRIHVKRAETDKEPQTVDMASMFTIIHAELNDAREKVKTIGSNELDIITVKLGSEYMIEDLDMTAIHLRDLLQEAANDEYDGTMFAVNFVLHTDHFAHIYGLYGKNGSEQYNLWYYDKEQHVWERASEIYIHTRITQLAGVLYGKKGLPFKPTDVTAAKAAREIAAKNADSIKIVKGDEQEADWLNNSYILPDGKRWILSEGRLVDIEPNTDFYRSKDSKFEFGPANKAEFEHEYSKEIELVHDMFKEIIAHDEWEMAFDIIAEGILGPMYAGKGKFLALTGETNTGKSLIVELPLLFLSQESGTTLTLERILTDNFSGRTLMNSRLNCSAEAAPTTLSRQSKLKNLIDNFEITIRLMFSDKQERPRRLPVLLFAMNKLFKFAQNDDMESVAERLLLLESIDHGNKGNDELKRWYSIFGRNNKDNIKTESQRRMIIAAQQMILRRASELYKDPSKSAARRQTRKDVMERYQEIHSRKIMETLEAVCIKTDEKDVCVDARWLNRQHTKLAKEKLKWDQCLDDLGDAGQDIVTTTVIPYHEACHKEHEIKIGGDKLCPEACTLCPSENCDRDKEFQYSYRYMQGGINKTVIKGWRQRTKADIEPGFTKIDNFKD